MGYFLNSTDSEHYAIDPTLQHLIGETDEKVKAQQNGRTPVYLVIEETNQLTPVEMIKGECSICDEVVVEDGEKVPILVGGRDGEKFIVASSASDGAWPKLPNNQQLVNMILAGVRVGQQTADPIRKCVDQNCLMTDDGRFVMTMRLTMSARLNKVTVMDAAAYRDRASEIIPIRHDRAIIHRCVPEPHPSFPRKRQSTAIGERDCGVIKAKWYK